MGFKGLLFILGMFWAGALLAQDAVLVQVEGQVLNQSDGEPVPNVHVWGSKRNGGTITDSSGWFQLMAYEHDTLVFSAVGYGQQLLAIPAEAAHARVTFLLVEKGYIINEVTVLPFSREGFKKAFLDAEPPPDKYAIHLNLPKLPKLAKSSRPLSRPLEIMLGIIQLDIYAIAGEKIVFKDRWEQKQVDKWVDREEYLQHIAAKYSPEFVKLIVPVSDEEVGPFLKFCNLENEFVAAATEYEIGIAVKECYVAWVETKAGNE